MKRAHRRDFREAGRQIGRISVAPRPNRRNLDDARPVAPICARSRKLTMSRRTSAMLLSDSRAVAFRSPCAKGGPIMKAFVRSTSVLICLGLAACGIEEGPGHDELARSGAALTSCSVSPGVQV